MLSRQCVSRPDGMGTLWTLAYIYSDAYALTSVISRNGRVFHRRVISLEITLVVQRSNLFEPPLLLLILQLSFPFPRNSLEHLVPCGAKTSGRKSTLIRGYHVDQYMIGLSGCDHVQLLHPCSVPD